MQNNFENAYGLVCSSNVLANHRGGVVPVEINDGWQGVTTIVHGHYVWQLVQL